MSSNDNSNSNFFPLISGVLEAIQNVALMTFIQTFDAIFGLSWMQEDPLFLVAIGALAYAVLFL